MREELPPINEYTAAQKTLLAATRRAGDAMSPFANWLLGGFGAGFALVLANIETVSKFIAVTHIRFGLLVFLGSLGVAVLGTYLSTMVKAGLGAQEDGELLGRTLQTEFDLSLFIAEYERGLLPPVKWIARAQMNKALRGDVAASARMLAKLSQVHALLVVCQSLLALVALGAMAAGLRLQ